MPESMHVLKLREVDAQDGRSAIARKRSSHEGPSCGQLVQDFRVPIRPQLG